MKLDNPIKIFVAILVHFFVTKIMGVWVFCRHCKHEVDYEFHCLTSDNFNYFQVSFLWVYIYFVFKRLDIIYVIVPQLLYLTRKLMLLASYFVYYMSTWVKLFYGLLMSFQRMGVNDWTLGHGWILLQSTPIRQFDY